MTNLRLVSPEDTQAVQKLWQYCFADEERFVQWYFRQYYKPENTLGIFEKERLLAATQVIDYTLMLRTLPFAAGYVVGVSTAPDARRQGLGEQMLAGALQLMRQRGQGLSLLMPFEGEFYYRYQWQFAYFQQRLELAVNELRGLAKPYGRLRLVEAKEHLPELQAVYHRFCQGRNGYILRDAAKWQKLLTDTALQQGFCCILYQGDQPEGYALYTMQGQGIQIIEMAYVHYQARCGLLDYFYSHRSHRQTFYWPAPADESLPYELSKSKEAITLYPYLMLRIVDAEQILTAFTYPQDIVLSFRMKLTDSLAPWNNGIFAVTIDKGKASITRLGDSLWDIAMDIGALSLLLSGTASCQELLWRGLLTVKDELLLKEWQALWPKMNNWINEDY